ncbi:MAG TPA: hypothetical protein VL426_08055 [Candidatus Binatia bacterium]|jgi:hypothetical protein|nr:hypothetical protein [Candidatus Binatia bacterium]
MGTTESGSLTVPDTLAAFIGSFAGGVVVRLLAQFLAPGLGATLAFIAVFSAVSGLIEIPLQMWRRGRPLGQAAVHGAIDAAGVFCGFAFLHSFL